jgi:hypothetical protein
MVTVFVNKSPQTPTENGAFEPQESFVQRLLNFSISLASNSQSNQPATFDTTTGSNTVLLSGFRASVRVDKSGAATSMAEIAIWGLPKDLMNQLATLGMAIQQLQQKNTITVYAGSSSTFSAGVPAIAGQQQQQGSDLSSLIGGGFTPVFSGIIVMALPDYNQAPDVPLRLVCSGNASPVAPAKALSFPGSVDVATAMSGIAKQMGVGFENNGINITLPASYYPGTLQQQMEKMGRDAHINAQIVTGPNAATPVLAIWPIGGSRTTLAGGSGLSTGASIPVVGPTSGMIGYPSFAQNNYIVVKMVFNPRVALGGQIQLQSEIPQANNKIVVIYNLALFLESLVPDGKWEATAQCWPLGISQPAPVQPS